MQFSTNSWNDKQIRIARDSRYVCLTDLAKATDKQVANWTRLKSTQEYLFQYSAATGMPLTEKGASFRALICITQGIGLEQGTWAHPKVALKFAQWCLPDLAIQVESWVNDLLTLSRLVTKDAMEFSIQIASDLFNSTEQFAVDFEAAWKWLGYFDKPTAKRALLSCNFTQDIDFCISAALSTASNPRPKECITLTVDCFKTWGMLAGTEQGKQVRIYFLQCEQQLKQHLQHSETKGDFYLDETKLAKQIVELAAQGIDIAYSGLGLKQELIASLKLNIVEQVTPALKPYLQESRQLLINSTAQPDRLLTATEIGSRLSISAQAVNKRLVALGLQTKNENKRSKKDCSYVACGQGASLSDLTLATGSGKDQTTYQQLRWYESVIPLLQQAVLV